MLRKWTVWCAPRQAPFSNAAEVATLFDWLSITPTARVSHALDEAQSKASVDTSRDSDAQRHPDWPHAVTLLARPASWTSAQSRVWAEAVVLLTRSGSGSQALAALRTFPEDWQRVVLMEANRRGLPHAVCLEWRKQLGLAGEHTAGADAEATSASPPPLHPTSGEVVSTSRFSSPLNVKEMSTAELMQRAFTLRRPHVAGTSVVATEEAVRALANEQAVLFRELASRGRYKEVVQCTVHWQQRNLLLEHPAAAAAATATASVVVTSSTASSSLLLFDGFQALKTALFPMTATTSAIGSRAARHHLLLSQPVLYARCVRDAKVADRLLRLDGPDLVRDAVVHLLRAIQGTALDTRGASLPALCTSTPTSLTSGEIDFERSSTVTRGQTATTIDTLWRGVAMLTRLLQASLRRDNNAHKQALVGALADAAAHTAAQHRQRTVALTEKTVAAVRTTTESVTSTLIHNEAQVRFVGLGVFAVLAESLECLCGTSSPGLPNALVQCLLLCLNGPVAVARDTTTASDPSPTLDYLRATPTERWAPALAMLHAAQTSKNFVVTSAHLRSLLSGLQSVSIVKTWEQALKCADFCVQTLHLTPDESSLERLLLNLKQASWQDAFRVFDYIPASASTPPPLPSARILRDLQLVAVKHASWEVTLRLMDQLLDLERQQQHPQQQQDHKQAEDSRRTPRSTRQQERDTQLQAAPAVTVVGFMNRVYCVYAAASGGQLALTLQHLHSLADAPQYSERARVSPRGRAASQGSPRGSTESPLDSPFNAVTVAIGAMAFLDHGHFAACAEYGQRVLRECAAPAAAGDATPFVLTRAGQEVAAAATVLGLLFSDQQADLVRWLNTLAAATPGDSSNNSSSPVPLPSLDAVLDKAMVLQAMRALGHLSAPVRLVFDTLAAGHYADCDDTKSFETRQRSTNAQRRPLYIPPRHYRAQVRQLVTGLGTLVVSPPRSGQGADAEVVSLSNEAAQRIAEAVTTAGFGPEFLSVTLLGPAD